MLEKRSSGKTVYTGGVTSNERYCRLYVQHHTGCINFERKPRDGNSLLVYVHSNFTYILSKFSFNTFLRELLHDVYASLYTLIHVTRGKTICFSFSIISRFLCQHTQHASSALENVKLV